jgi:UDP-glucose 4-epimerase
MRALVTGGRGMIGSHLVDALVERGDEVDVVDNCSSGENENPGASYVDLGIHQISGGFYRDFDAVFHTAAIGRTPWAVADPVRCWETNLLASVRLLEGCRQAEVPRVVLSSSNIVYAAETPYKASKLAMEEAAKVYTELYGLSTICLRYSNVYGKRQREDGIGPNAFASMRKSLREKGYVEITGDGEQGRDWTHVSDVVEANLLAAESEVTGTYDITSGCHYSMNDIVRLLDCPVRYVPEREGDIKEIRQDPTPAAFELGFAAKVALEDGIWDCFERSAVGSHS